MRNSLLEKLEALPRYDQIEGWIHPDDNALERIDDGEYVEYRRVRAIIEQHKTEVAAHIISNSDRLPVDVRIAGGTVGKGCNFETLMIRINAFNKFYDENLANKDLQKEMRERLMKLTEPSPDIIAELVKALETCVYVMEHTLIAERQASRVYEDWDKSLTETNALLARAKSMTE